MGTELETKDFDTSLRKFLPVVQKHVSQSGILNDRGFVAFATERDASPASGRELSRWGDPALCNRWDTSPSTALQAAATYLCLTVGSASIMQSSRATAAAS